MLGGLVNMSMLLVNMSMLLVNMSMLLVIIGLNEGRLIIGVRGGRTAAAGGVGVVCFM